MSKFKKFLSLTLLVMGGVAGTFMFPGFCVSQSYAEIENYLLERLFTFIMPDYPVYLYALGEANTYTIYFDGNGGVGTMDSMSMTYDKEENLLSNNFTRDGYTFKGWSSSATGDVEYLNNSGVINLTAENLGIVTLYAQREENIPSGRGGRRKSDNPDHGAAPEDVQTGGIIGYDQELIDAYNWAYSLGITSKSTIDDARLYDDITREELAKMMVVFISKELGRRPVRTYVPKYLDVSEESRGVELARYIILAYQYQIMGIHANGTPLTYFDPEGKVTRGEFATVLSRVLYGSKYNKEGSEYYERHVQTLQNAGILMNTDPNIIEQRGRIILMLYRSSRFLPSEPSFDISELEDIINGSGSIGEDNIPQALEKINLDNIVMVNMDDVTDMENSHNAGEDSILTGYDQELIDAYNWAYSLGITSKSTIDDARLYDNITREELAKMMVVFVSKELGRQPVRTYVPKYWDVSEKSRGAELARYIILAYQYQIMGIHANGTPLTYFDPDGKVTRGEFATVLSRVLYGSRYNKEGSEYYERHVQTLQNAGILINTDPNIIEQRGRIILMLYRSQAEAGRL